MLRPFGPTAGENPYTIHADLQDTMQDLVGIIRTESELRSALTKLEELNARLDRVSVQGGRVYNPGWNLALDLHSMLEVAEVTTRSALLRTESRGGHTREDFPKTDSAWGKKNIVTTKRGGTMVQRTDPLLEMPPELAKLFEEAH